MVPVTTEHERLDLPLLWKCGKPASSRSLQLVEQLAGFARRRSDRARRREFSALRAVGFSRLAILVSITLESLALSLPGALLGVIVAWLLFDGHVGQVSDLAFPITVTPDVALVGVVFTIAIGLVGGLVPAIASARQPLATALRAT